jgi:anti-anti-sigma regulatory factor
MAFRISQERCAGAPATFRLAGRLAGDAVEVLTDTCVDIAAGVTIDLSELSYADDAGVRALGELRARGAILHGPRPYLALLLQQEGALGG